MEIVENGPLLIHADKILKRAMDNYWKDITKQENGTLCRKNKVIDRLKAEKSKFDRLYNKYICQRCIVYWFTFAFNIEPYIRILKKYCV